MKIAFFQPPAAHRVGGVEAAIQGLAAALRFAGAEVTLDSTGVEADVAHFHGLWQPQHRRAARGLVARGVPYVVSPHGMLEPWAWRHKRWKKWPYFALFERHYLARAAALLATSEMEARRLRAFFPRQTIASLPLGLSGNAAPDYAASRARFGWAESEFVILFLSRIDPKKGLDLLLQALIGVREKGGIRLVIVGEGDPKYLAKLRSFAAANVSALPQIDWIGPAWGDARWPYFQGADLFCLPSHSENFGLAVLEACQVGTPVLTSSATPWPELLGGRATIVDPSSASIQAGLETALQHGKASAEARDEFAAWTREQFDWRALAPRYLAFYEGIRQSRLAE
jgi:glycosyltransferase involved in cell wall biosynthesis